MSTLVQGVFIVKKYTRSNKLLRVFREKLLKSSDTKKRSCCDLLHKQGVREVDTRTIVTKVPRAVYHGAQAICILSSDALAERLDSWYALCRGIIGHNVDR